MPSKEIIRDDKQYKIEKTIREQNYRSYDIHDKARDINFFMDIKKGDHDMCIDVTAQRGEVSKHFSKRVTQQQDSEDPYSLDCMLLSVLKMHSVGTDKPDERSFNPKLTRTLLSLVGDEILEAPKRRKDFKLEKEGTTREEVKQHRKLKQEEERRRKEEERQREEEERRREEEERRLAPLREALNNDLIAIAHNNSKSRL